MKKIFYLAIVSIIIICGINSVSATTVSPAVLELNANPGENIVKEIMIFNETDADLKLAGYIQTFIPRGESGEAEIINDVNYQAVGWAKLSEQDMVLSPQEIRKINLSINIPQTASVGGYYLAVMWETSPSHGSENGAVAISSRVGSLVLLRVGDEIQEALTLEEFTKINSGDSLVNFAVKLNNSGNVHLQPTGMLVIKNCFGRAVDSVEFNTTKRNILPQSLREFELGWLGDSNYGFTTKLKTELVQHHFGYYRARLDLHYGNNQSFSSSEVGFWILPWRAISLLIVLVVIIIMAKRIIFNKK